MNDYDPGRTEELCNKEHQLGRLFLNNLKACAECIKEKGHLDDYFDKVDAQNARDYVNLCQSLDTSDHKEMVSAMSVIMETGGVLGDISKQVMSTSITSPTSTNAPTTNFATTTQTSKSETTSQTSSSTPTGTTESQPASEASSKAWIAGPVVGSVAGVSGIIGAAFLLIRRRNRRQKAAQLTAEQDGGPSKPYEKPELPAEERIRHELDGQSQSPVEAMAKVPPQELNSVEVAELPAHNGK